MTTESQIKGTERERERKKKQQNETFHEFCPAALLLGDNLQVWFVSKDKSSR